jgi:hypothetical protein
MLDGCVTYSQVKGSDARKKIAAAAKPQETTMAEIMDDVPVWPAPGKGT